MVKAGAAVLIAVGVVRAGGVAPGDVDQRRTLEVGFTQVGPSLKQVLGAGGL